ncbi:MAG: hypothetical protein Tsb0034_09680 [Ekhidna sp.]
MKLISPEEIFELYPELQTKLNWRRQDIGIFLRCRLLRGYYDSGRRVSMIEKESLIELMKFSNCNLDKQKADI